jgi:SAF domain
MATTVDRVRSEARRSPVRLPPTASGRTARVPEIALGVLLVGIFALGSVLWQTSRAKKEQLVVPRHDLTRGAVIADDDLRPVDVNRGSGLDVVRWDERADIVGHVALVPLAADAPVSPAMVGALPPSDPADRLVGLRLEPGDYPSVDLRPGALVDVVAVPATGASVEQAPTVLATRALVRRVDGAARDPGDGTVSVTIEVTPDVAYRVTTAAGSVHLVQVPD